MWAHTPRWTIRRRSSRELEERFGRTLSPELFQHLQHLLVALLGGCRGEGVWEECESMVLNVVCVCGCSFNDTRARYQHHDVTGVTPYRFDMPRRL